MATCVFQNKYTNSNEKILLCIALNSFLNCVLLKFNTRNLNHAVFCILLCLLVLCLNFYHFSEYNLQKSYEFCLIIKKSYIKHYFRTVL